MGRPALGPKIEVRLPIETLARIDRALKFKEGARPAFIREAIDRELRRRERAAASSDTTNK